MGMIQKTVVGSLIVGAGALALAQNKKAVARIGKNVDKAVKKAVHAGSGEVKKLRSSVSKASRAPSSTKTARKG